MTHKKLTNLLFGIIGVLIISLALAVFNISELNDKKSTASVSTNTSTITASEEIDIDNTYQMFFGKWKFTKVLGRDGEEAADLLDKTIYFYYDEVYMDEVKQDFVPSYTVQTMPLNDITNSGIWPDYPPLTEMGLTGNVIIYVYNSGTYERDESRIGKPTYDLIVQDDNTLFISVSHICYELKRLEYAKYYDVSRADYYLYPH